jgi:hypothetical protein
MREVGFKETYVEPLTGKDESRVSESRASCGVSSGQ